MTSVSPAEGPSILGGALRAVAISSGHIPMASRLPTLFKEMITVAMTVVVAVGLILYLLSVPPYYELKLTRERGDGVSSENHQVEGKVKMGLEYALNWRVRHWGANFASVRIH
jgi:hypothetical protein